MTAQERFALEAPAFAELERDPYPTLARWRRETPIGFLDAFGGWVVTRFDDCDAIGKAEEKLDAYNASSTAFFGTNILNIDGDPHTRLRGAVDLSLRPKAVRGYIETLARPVVKDYVAAVKERGRLDATTELLELISVRVVSNVMGLAELDDATLQRWFQDLSSGLVNFAEDPDVAERARTAKEASSDFTIREFERLRASPEETTFSHMLLSNTENGEPRSFEELIGTIWVIILGGFQEPGHAAAASLLGLLRNPDQHRAAREDLSLVPAAIHEGLRWIAPFGGVQRRAITDIEIGDVVIPSGDEINLWIASANRDESRYDRGELFDLFRPRLPVASFGYGAHFCAGHFLARELEKVALEEMLLQLPNMRLDPDDDPTVFGFGVRGVKNLPIVWDA